jgi:hypothetical protein
VKFLSNGMKIIVLVAILNWEPDHLGDLEWERNIGTKL